jgi:hypothetical protein
MPVLSTKASCQRAHLLEYLRVHKSITILGARQILDILHPAARIQTMANIAWDGMFCCLGIRLKLLSARRQG